MADARALLRAHRADNRIEHPHAAYSGAGKLLCKLCHEAIRSDALWESHVASASHRQKEVAALKAKSAAAGSENDQENSNKRKHDDLDEDMVGEDGQEEEEADAIRKKRSKPDMISLPPLSTNVEKEKTSTPPTLARRTSSTPAHGVEIAIPSRPATPLVGDHSAASASSTPRPGSFGRASFPGSGGGSSNDASTPRTNGAIALRANATAAGPAVAAAASFVSTAATTTAAAPPADGDEVDEVDEAEWAAFQADIAAADEPPTTATTNGYAPDATISAPAMTAEQAAKSAEEETERRKREQDARADDEREDAARAMEAEFDEMEELEGRVRRLKERREELRRESVANLRARVASDVEQPRTTAGGKGAASGKENLGVRSVLEVNNESDEEEEDDDDWEDGFRFRA